MAGQRWSPRRRTDHSSPLSNWTRRALQSPFPPDHLFGTKRRPLGVTEEEGPDTKTGGERPLYVPWQPSECGLQAAFAKRCFQTICTFSRCSEPPLLNNVKYFDRPKPCGFKDFSWALTVLPPPCVSLVVIFSPKAFRWVLSIWHQSVGYFLLVASKSQTHLNLWVHIFRFLFHGISVFHSAFWGGNWWKWSFGGLRKFHIYSKTCFIGSLFKFNLMQISDLG